MSSTVSRTFRSVPERSASATWQAIVNLLAPQAGSARAELQSVEGVACALITDKAFISPLILTGAGPRVRIYCLYDDDALEGDRAAEQPLNFDATDGSWAASLPCDSGDLAWVMAALKGKSSRITARDKSQGISLSEGSNDNDLSKSAVVQFDEEAFLRS